METRRLSDLSLTDLVNMEKIIMEEQKTFRNLKADVLLKREDWKLGLVDPEEYPFCASMRIRDASNKALLRRINAEINNFIDSFRIEEEKEEVIKYNVVMNKKREML